MYKIMKIFLLFIPLLLNATTVSENTNRRYDIIEWISQNTYAFDIIVLSFLIIVGLVVYTQYMKRKLEKNQLELEESFVLLKQQREALDEHSIVSITDVKGNITYVNDKFVEISGYSFEELIGQNHRLLNSGQHNSTFWKNMYETVSRGDVWRNPAICNIKKDATVYWVNTVIVPFMKNGKPESYVAIRTDITDNVEIENELEQLYEESQVIMQEKEVLNEKLEKLAYYDALTKIPNRLNIMENLEKMLVSAKRHSMSISVMFIDLDGFKLVNDTLNHDTGDRVLMEVAEVLENTLRVDDFYGRLGGDEFLVIALGTDEKKGLKILCDKLLNNINKIELPSPVGEHFGASIGVVHTIPTENIDVETLLNESDNVMYEVKKQGKNSYKIKEL